MLSRASLKTQILSLVMGVLFVALGSLAVLTFYQIRSKLENNLVKKGLSISKMLTENLGPGLDFQDSAYVYEVAQIAFNDEDVIGVAVFDNDMNTYFVQSPDSSIYKEIKSCNLVSEICIEKENGLYKIERPIYFRNKPVGCLWLVLNRENILGQINYSIQAVLFGAIVVLALVFLISTVFARKIVNPINLFESAAERIRAGDLISPIEINAVQKDFKNLGKIFNDMQKSLRDAFLKLREAKENLEARVQVRTRELSAELTEREKAEMALRRNERLLMSTIESTADGIMVVDENGHITHSNSRFADIWQIPPEIIGTNDDHIVLKFILSQVENPDVFLQRIEEVNLSISEHSDTIYLSDGRVFDRYSCPLINDGKHAGRVWSFSDITEQVRNQEKQKKLQEDLEKAERMESLGLLAGGVAHDLNNMLGPLVAYPDLIIETIEPDSPVVNYSNTMKIAAKSAASVIQDLLTLARRGRYEMDTIDLNEVVKDYQSSAHYRSLSDNFETVQINTDLAAESLTIEGSSPHLTKVVMNLIVNACDAMPDGGFLNIRTFRQEIARSSKGIEKIKPGIYNVLSVRDTGTGIEAKDLEKIFEPYYSKKKMGSSGSGLGLSVVYGVVKDHGGFYDVKSDVGQGTEFLLYFPLSEKQIKHETESGEDLKGEGKILVVDDNEGQRELASVLLKSLGYTVVTAIHGHAALEYLKDNSVDLIVLDMIMEEDFDGLDTYREIIKIHPGQKALIVSGYSTTDRVNELQSMGAGKYIKKPYTRSILGQAVKEILDNTLAYHPVN